MTLYSLWELLNFISGRYPNGQSISPERMNIVLPQVQREFFFDRVRAGDSDALQPFSKTMGDDSTPLTFSSGFADLPPDYYSGGSGYYMLGANPRHVNFVSDRAFEYAIVHPTEYPTLEYPVGCIQGNRVKIRPKDVNHIRFTYYTRPVDPVFDYCIDLDNPSRIVYMPVGSYLETQGALKDSTGVVLETNVESRTGAYRYNSATVELQWPEAAQWKLLYLMLIKVGVSLAEGEAEKLAQVMLQQ